jgi:hypothetical protein
MIVPEFILSLGSSESELMPVSRKAKVGQSSQTTTEPKSGTMKDYANPIRHPLIADRRIARGPVAPRSLPIREAADLSINL